MNKVFIILSILLATTQWSQASHPSETRAKVYSGNYSNPNYPMGWWGYLGLNLGVVDSETKLKHEKDAGGSQFDLRVLASYYLPNSNWLGDMGLGWQNSHFGKGQMDRNVSAGYLELSSRYRFAQAWQVGPVGKIFILGDRDFFADSETPVAFIGAALNYEFPWLQENPVRLGARILSDINVDSRRVTMAMVDFQIGMPFSSRPQIKTVSRKKTHPIKEIPKKETSVEENEIVVNSMDEIVSHELKDVKLSSHKINFLLGKVSPKQNVQYFLSRLGELLSKEPELFQTVQVLGHSDHLGKPLTREILSHSRAQLVAKAMSAAGLSIDKISIKGLSDRQPLSEKNESNRRVEIIFTGVTNETRLQEIINQAL